MDTVSFFCPEIIKNRKLKDWKIRTFLRMTWKRIERIERRVLERTED